jgi:hypothetical protein
MHKQASARQTVRAVLLIAFFAASTSALVAQVSLPAPYVDPFAPSTASSTETGKRPSPVLTFGTEGGYVTGGEADYWNGPTGRVYIGLDYASKYFDLVADLSMYDNKKYGATPANFPGGRLGNLYFLMDNGGVRTHFGPLSFSAGRFQQYDVIDSPYSLFVNSNGNSALGMRLDYEDDFFFYETRWIELNDRSDVTSPSFLSPMISRTAGPILKSSVSSSPRGCVSASRTRRPIRGGASIPTTSSIPSPGTSSST